MDGTAELRQLAHLLRIGADAARDIALLRPDDAEAIERLAKQAVAIAVEVEEIANGSKSGSFLITPVSSPSI